MTILLSNDDGIDAPGLEALRQALAGLDDLVICAPSRNHSGMGSAITVGRPIAAERLADGPGGEPRYAVSGTPADAVKYGLRQVLGGQTPRLVASGINHGPNIGQNVRYSGTVGAALEGAWAGASALAVSVDYTIPPVWDAGIHYARKVAEKMLAHPRPLFLNLNAPAGPASEGRGFCLVRHGRSGYEEFFVEHGDDGSLKIDGAMRHRDTNDDTDGHRFLNGYATLTPLSLDWTSEHALAELRDAGWGDLS